MHPYLAESLGRERLKSLRREAEHDRLAAAAGGASRTPEHAGRVRVMLGERLVRLGIRLAGPEARLVARMGE